MGFGEIAIKTRAFTKYDILASFWRTLILWLYSYRDRGRNLHRWWSKVYNCRRKAKADRRDVSFRWETFATKDCSRFGGALLNSLKMLGMKLKIFSHRRQTTQGMPETEKIWPLLSTTRKSWRRIPNSCNASYYLERKVYSCMAHWRSKYTESRVPNSKKLPRSHHRAFER